MPRRLLRLIARWLCRLTGANTRPDFLKSFDWWENDPKVVDVMREIEAKLSDE